MAGNAAAYLQLRPIQSDIGNDVKYWADAEFRRKQQEAINAQNAAKQRAAEQKARQERIDKYSANLKNYDTGSSSLNELNGRIIAETVEQIGDIATQLETQNLPIEQRVKLTTKLNTLKNMPENLKEFTGALTKRNAEIDAMLQKGQIKDDENLKRYKDTFENGFKNFNFVIDDNGFPGVVYRDVNGDGINDAEGYETIADGVSAFQFTKNVDMDSLATTIAQRQGKVSNETQEGFTTTKTEGPDPELLEADIYSSLIGKDGNLTDAGKSFMYDLGLEDSLENRDKMVQEFSNMVNSRIDRSKSVTTDQSAITSRMRENRIQSEESGDGKNVVLSAIEGVDGVTSSNAEVQDYGYNANGDLVLQVSVPKTKSITKNDFSDLEKKAAAGDKNAQQQLELAQITGDGGAKIVIPGENETRTITVQEKDKGWVADRIGAKDKTKRISTQSSGTYKGLDENGDPIFEE
jgi:hypothetical protein